MKILHISGARSWGGNEQQLVDLIPELEKLGVENIILGVTNSPLHNYIKTTSIQFIAAKDHKLNKRSNYRYLKTVIKTQDPDVIHLHTSDSVTVFTISDLLYNLKTPAVFSKKGMGNSMSRLSIYKYNYKNIKAIICVSEAVKRSMEELVMKPKNAHKLKVVYDGINTNRLTPKRFEQLTELFPIPKDKPLVGNIANHVNAKDLPVLLRAIQHMVQTLNYTNFHLVQIGEGSRLTPELEQLVQELSIGPYITWAGFQQHATDFLPQLSVYVMSSQREGLPLTIYEAFYKKVPVVSTRAGGIPEVITDEENGFLVDVKDHEALAKKLKTLLEHPEMQKSFAEASYKKFIENFEAAHTAQNTLKVYDSIL
ncbi:glycosyltransferase family 4 protein [Altibacter sp.]|uniref:glycosyltransferase family 4 protein n=1 Tax=Altibacter sp. TaxID=2024823 RepID=UPI002585975C|nr:glycosyltransferase family 4 protein [Altibacter sp.]MCW9037457.1 glycosyltransferase family 4 protein [Altibacter sp.]